MANRVYYLDRDGQTPQIKVANERQKVKRYASLVAANTDIANIDNGEIVATDDGAMNIANAWIGTQAQYGALEVEDDTICFIINEGTNEYSTDETITDATWIDGKPIYRKCYHIDGTSAISSKTIDTLTDIDSIILMTGTAHISDGNWLQFGYSGSYDVSLRWNKGSNNTLYIETNYTVYGYNIIIEYTKTTD